MPSASRDQRVEKEQSSQRRDGQQRLPSGQRDSVSRGAEVILPCTETLVLSEISMVDKKGDTVSIPCSQTDLSIPASPWDTTSVRASTTGHRGSVE